MLVCVEKGSVDMVCMNFWTFSNFGEHVNGLTGISAKSMTVGSPLVWFFSRCKIYTGLWCKIV